MHPERHRTGERLCAGGNGIQHVRKRVGCIGQRGVELSVTVLHGHGQDDRLHARKAGARVFKRHAARRRMPLECKRAHRVAVSQQERGQMRLPHVPAGDRKGHGFCHRENLLCAILCRAPRSGARRQKPPLRISEAGAF